MIMLTTKFIQTSNNQIKQSEFFQHWSYSKVSNRRGGWNSRGGWKSVKD